jgi:DNA-binding transcriptional regulator YiaG
MIDLANESLLSLGQAASALPASRQGSRVSPSTIWRWIVAGVTTPGGRVQLEAIRLGGRWLTSKEALQRFAERQTPQQPVSTSFSTSIRTLSQRERHEQWVEDQLDDVLGIRKCEQCRAEIVAPKRAISRHEKVWCPRCLIQRRTAKLGERIRTFRWAAMLSQEALSGRTGISTELIRAYEFNRKKPPEDHFANLIEVLGKDLVSGLEPNEGSPD